MAERVFRIAYRWQLNDGVIGINTFHIGVETDGTTVAAALAEFDGTIRAPLKGLLSTTDELLDVQAVEQQLTGAALTTPEEALIVINEAGTLSLADRVESPALCCVGSWQTGVASRRARGRIFFPPAQSQGQLQDGGLFQVGTGKYFTKCTDLGNLVVTHSFGLGVQPVVYSKVAALASAANVWFHITGFRMLNKQRWLRSRELGRP